MSDVIKEISIDLIDDPSIAMRSDVHDDEIDSLADSIKTHGLLEPLVVRPKSDRYELIAGHRRLTACKIISKIMIPCTIRDVSENEALILRIQENTHRLDVNPVDDAVYIGRMLQQLKCGPAELAKLMKRSVGFIYDRLSLLDMPEYILEPLAMKKINIGTAQQLMKITDDAYRQSLVDIAVRQGCSVDNAERWVQMWKVGAMPTTPTLEAVQAATDENAPPEATVVCAKCGEQCKVRDGMTVWIHRSCP